MSSSSSSKSSTNEVRYAPYIENKHHAFLDIVQTHRTALSLLPSPYANYNEIMYVGAFFSSGYSITSFPPLYDMFGKFAAGLDIEDIWKRSFNKLTNNTTITSFTQAELDIIDNEIDENAIAPYDIQMRDLSAVESSTFAIGRALIEVERVKERGRIALENDSRYLSITVSDYLNQYLEHNKRVIFDISQYMKLYYLVAMDIDEANTKFDARDKLWTFEVLDFEREALAALQAKSRYHKAQGRSRSQLSQGLLISSYAVQGAVIGSYFPGIGTVIGGAAGALVGIAVVFAEAGQLQQMTDTMAKMSLIFGDPFTSFLWWATGEIFG